MEINAAVVEEKSSEFRFHTLELEEPNVGEVRVKIVATGICHTDIAIRDGIYPVSYPFVLGHEGAGIIEKVGAGVTKVKAGDHVVIGFNYCGHCPSCEQGKPSYCYNFFEYNFGGKRHDGTFTVHENEKDINANFFGQSSFATFAIAHEANVVKVPTDVPLEMLGPLGCGLQTGAGGVINNLKPKAGSTIAIFGVGTVGLAAIMAAKIVGCNKIIALDIFDNRLDLAIELGATHKVNTKVSNAVEEILRLTNGIGVDYTIDATGIPAVTKAAIDALAPRGKAGLIGAAPVGTIANFDAADLLLKGKTITGIVEGDSVGDVFIPQLIEFYKKGQFPFDRLIQYYEFDQINDAILDMKSGKTIKPILRIS